MQNLSGNVSYTYDELGQLVSETNGNTTYQYAYDSKGNISSRKAYSGETLVDTDTFTYGATAWKDRLTGYNNGTITYDTIGNPTSYLGATLTWRGRELSKYVEGNKQISYSYDVDGMRYQKIVKTSGVETARYDYVYSDGKLILLTHTANGVANTARFIYDSFGEPRGFILNNSSAYLYLKNGQGDITAIVDENGEILVRYTYNAWGAVEFIVPFGIDPAVTTVLATVSPFTYRGYCYDFDLGLYYLQSRYYDPEICRFINADSTDYLGATGTLLSYNLFAYCENDPVDYVDPSGCYIYYEMATGAYREAVAVANSLFTSPNYPYFKITYTKKIGYMNHKFFKYTVPSYVHYKTTYNTKKQNVTVVYIPYMGIKSRVVGTFIYKTVLQWKLYIASRHTNFFVKYRDALLKKLKISKDDYTIFMFALSDAAKSMPQIDMAVTVYSVLEIIFDELAKYRDSTDKYILRCLKGKKDNTYVMIAWSLAYQTYTFTNNGWVWKTTESKSIHQYT